MSGFKKVSEIESSSGIKRRSFLKKSATGAVLVSLPAQSVWGACSVSGAMSGNLSQNTGRHDCPPPALPAGKTPSWWRNVYNNTNNNNTNTNRINGFNSINGTTERECYREEIKGVMDNNGMALATELFPSPQMTLHDSVFSGQALEKKLAAVFLNSYFGFYGAADERDLVKANERVNDILIYVILQETQENPIANDQLNTLLNLTNANGSAETYYTSSTCV